MPVLIIGCTKEYKTSGSAFRIVHDSDDQSLTALVIRSDGGFIASVINTFSSDPRTADFGIMGINADSKKEFHRRNGYYFSSITLSSIVESKPGIYIGAGINVTTNTAYRRSGLFRFDNSGNIIDSSIIVVNGTRFRYGVIQKLRDGNFLLMAVCLSTSNSSATYLRKFNADLDKIWETTIEGNQLGVTHFRGFNFVETSQNNIIVAGICSPATTVNGMYNEGRLALARLNPAGLRDTQIVLAYNRYRIVGSVVEDAGKILVFSSARVIEAAGGKRELSINTFNLDLDSLNQKRLRHGQESWLDANFMVKRKGGWFASGFTEGTPTFFYFTQKAFLFLLDDNFNVIETKRFGTERIASFVQMIPRNETSFLLAYCDYLPGATRYGYDLVMEELDEMGRHK